MDKQRRASSEWSWWIISEEEEKEGDGWKELIAKDQMIVAAR